MKQMRFKYCIAAMSHILEVSKSGYYQWFHRNPSKRVLEEGRLEIEIKAAHKRTRETCGPERLQHELKEQGVEVGICRIRRIRKKLGIRCKQRRKFRATTDSKHALPVVENLLNQQFEATGGRTKFGLVTLPISPPKKAGFILQGIRIFLREKS
jgi:putative transposase